MPNHCSNLMIVRGPGDALREFKSKAELRNGEGYTAFAVDNFLPVPEAIKCIQYGGMTIDGKTYSSWHDHGNGRRVGIGQEESARLIAEYGADNWYNWAIQNWGTKWGAYDVELRDLGTRLQYTYHTAWSPLNEHCCRFISEKFPSLKFTWRYAECGSAFKGEITMVNGMQQGLYVNSEATENDYKNPKWAELLNTSG